MKILITGGAGFVGSYLARSFAKEFPDSIIVVMDNLKRSGSELNLKLFKDLGINFVHGDIRVMSDFEPLDGNFDFMIEASAEPSVHAGVNGQARYLLDTNLVGTLNCLAFAKKFVRRTIFLSTSRVYSITDLKSIPLIEDTSRFRLDLAEANIEGLSVKGISENFNTREARSLYGMTKLASEMICQEYSFTYGTQILINRCGVIAGPGQFGKVDQGVFTLWVANHVFNKALKYLGFGGLGKQVRDLLHPKDLYELIKKQLESPNGFNAEVYNIGGGNDCSSSLCELTELCQQVSKNEVEILSEPETSAVDVPYYISDYTKAKREFNWSPKLTVKDIVVDIHQWIEENKTILQRIF